MVTYMANETPMIIGYIMACDFANGERLFVAEDSEIGTCLVRISPDIFKTEYDANIIKNLFFEKIGSEIPLKLIPVIVSEEKESTS